MLHDKFQMPRIKQENVVVPVVLYWAACIGDLISKSWALTCDMTRASVFQRLSLLLPHPTPQESTITARKKMLISTQNINPNSQLFKENLNPKRNDKWPILNSSSNAGIRAVFKTWLVRTRPKQATEIEFYTMKGHIYYAGLDTSVTSPSLGFSFEFNISQLIWSSNC